MVPDGKLGPKAVMYGKKQDDHEASEQLNSETVGPCNSGAQHAGTERGDETNTKSANEHGQCEGHGYFYFRIARNQDAHQPIATGRHEKPGNEGNQDRTN